ncbi:amino acid ABC transporter substrate-binding protein [Natronolimnohabitans sp. A-GB9]|uniref:amino acid ABC transporter substrate-binding protein n=1 Tax=Natronolimnohabitans sp. A-GB9 TaxID=3069757 RepID=UPI0027B6AA1E|nr:amino acid ABC transporter substrate-binding protein [Natronolimnohabitans sp. A-GB9]MDQ2052686.1 amino acid ABC transporter substrate-binding protein [Natronolimnohabitans sp. A-GB9]
MKATGGAGVAGLAGCLGGESTVTATTSKADDSSDEDDGGHETPTDAITLGGSMSLSGDLSDLGRLYADAYELTIERINNAGGVEAGDGATYGLELVLRDDESDPSRSEAIYQELVNQAGIDYLVGPYSSGITLPASDVAASAERPMVAGGGASSQIFEHDNEWIFSLLPTADTYPTTSIEMAMAQPDPPSSAAILAKADPFNQDVAEGARGNLQSAGVDVVVDETIPDETTDISTDLALVEDADTDVLLLCGYQDDVVIAADQLANENVDVDVAWAPGGNLTDSFREQTGANGDYWYGPSPWATTVDSPDDVFESTSEFLSVIESEYGYEPTYHSAAASAVVQTFQRAFMAVDELAPRTVRDAIRETQFESLYGAVQFDEDGAIPREMAVFQWHPGAGRQLVWPEESSEADPIYPTPAWDER